MYYSSQHGNGLTNTKNAIRAFKPFKSSGALSANTVTDTYGPTGELARTDAWEQYNAEQPTYVVYSYRTPIAWYSEKHGWTVPEVKYSQTTTRHQSVVRAALGNY